VNDLKILWKYFREHKLAAMAVVAATFSGAVAGGVLGVLAYYHGWLG
jgi:ABC-type tungstate transport system substrate-binding protein